MRTDRSEVLETGSVEPAATGSFAPAGPWSCGRASRLLLLLWTWMSACYASNSSRCADSSCREAGPEADGGGTDVRPEDDGDGSGDIEPPAEDAGVEGEASPCPSEMVYVPSVGVCIDRYEASRGAGDLPVSVAGAMPWNRIGWRDARLACMRAGKRLCLPDEWEAACRGPMNYDYPYGPEAIAGYCNVAHIDPDTGTRLVYPTATFDRCEGGYPGLFDMIGNVAEWTDEHRYQEDAGGELALTSGKSYSIGSAGTKCPGREWWGAGFEQSSIGFRCCRTPP